MREITVVYRVSRCYQWAMVSILLKKTQLKYILKLYIYNQFQSNMEIRPQPTNKLEDHELSTDQFVTPRTPVVHVVKKHDQT